MLNRNDIHHTAQWSGPSPGGVSRLCADENDKKVRDWFRDQVLALGADYKVGNDSYTHDLAVDEFRSMQQEPNSQFLKARITTYRQLPWEAILILLRQGADLMAHSV